jgi:hypothetical protein
MIVLAGDYDAAKTFGHGIFRVLVDLGIQGLPPLPNGTAPQPRKMLPPAYGADFGISAVKHVLKYFKGDRERALDFLMDWLTDFLSTGRAKIDKSQPFQKVMSWLWTSLTRAAIDALRKSKSYGKDNADSLSQDEESGGGQVDLPTFRDMDDTVDVLMKLPPGSLEALFKTFKGGLDRVHPDAYAYLQLLLEGELSDSEILGWKGGKPAGQPKLPSLAAKYPNGVNPGVWAPWKAKIFAFLAEALEKGYRDNPKVRETLEEVIPWKETESWDLQPLNA